jgi:hypothetical protein
MRLYCIDEQPLPSGVSGSSKTATYGEGAVIYSLRDNGSTLSLSLQKKPSEKELANFVANLIPLHLEIDNPVGKASVGVHSGQTLISLPTKGSDTWMLITAPADYDPDRATALLKHIVKD